MKKYFRTTNDEAGEDWIAFEFDGDWAVRQVECYSGKLFCSNEDYHQSLGPGLCDQPLGEIGLTIDEEISATEFESLWRQALEAHHHKD